MQHQVNSFQSSRDAYNLNFSFHTGSSVLGLTDVLRIYLAGIRSRAVLSRFFLKLCIEENTHKMITSRTNRNRSNTTKKQKVAWMRTQGSLQEKSMKRFDKFG